MSRLEENGNNPSVRESLSLNKSGVFEQKVVYLSL